MALTDAQLREMAKERVGFRHHMVVFIVLNFCFFLLNVLTSPGQWWFYWITLFWGCGIVIHGYHVYVSDNVSAEEKEFKKLKARQKK